MHNITREEAVVAAVDFIDTLQRFAVFTSDDVCEAIAREGYLKEKRFVGPLLIRLARERAIFRGEGYAPSRRRHGSPVAIWRKG
jgi:hypothetical protein